MTAHDLIYYRCRRCGKVEAPHQIEPSDEGPPEKPRITVTQCNITKFGIHGDVKHTTVGVCEFCQALILPGKDAARKHVETHGGELVI